MNIIIDVEKTLAGEKYLMGVNDWRDYHDKEKLLGSKIIVGIPAMCEKIVVKVPMILDEEKFLLNGKIEFDNLNGVLYVANNKINVSWKADNVFSV